MKKRLFLMFLSFILVSCEGFFGVSEIPQPAKTIDEAKQKGLLIDVYNPSKKNLKVDGQEYLIVGVWTAHRFESSASKKINKDSFEFLIQLKNLKTNEIGFVSNLKFLECVDCPTDFGITNSSGNLSILFNKNDLFLDKIQLKAESTTGEIQIINFTKILRLNRK
jgi:hypothetical protein